MIFGEWKTATQEKKEARNFMFLVFDGWRQVGVESRREREILSCRGYDCVSTFGRFLKTLLSWV